MVLGEEGYVISFIYLKVTLVVLLGEEVDCWEPKVGGCLCPMQDASVSVVEMKI